MTKYTIKYLNLLIHNKMEKNLTLDYKTSSTTGKSKLLLIILGVIFSINMNSQNNLKIGVIAGINSPNNRGYRSPQFHSFKKGYLFGVSFDYYFKNNLSLKANINYERKIKNRYDYIERDDLNEVFVYINFPIALKYEFYKSKFFVAGGAFLNYLLNNQIPENPNGLNITKLKKVDFGLSLGIGTNISFKNKNNFTIEIRDELGIIDTSTYGSTNGTTKTNAVKLIVGWNLGI